MMHEKYDILTQEKGCTIPVELEYNTDELSFENGLIKYHDKEFIVKVNGDIRNQIIRFEKDSDGTPIFVMKNDAFPQDGEFTWMLDDVVLIEK
jgi:hypothetical protein